MASEPHTSSSAVGALSILRPEITEHIILQVRQSERACEIERARLEEKLTFFPICSHLFTISALLIPPSFHITTLSFQLLSDIWNLHPRLDIVSLPSARSLAGQTERESIEIRESNMNIDKSLNKNHYE